MDILYIDPNDEWSRMMADRLGPEMVFRWATSSQEAIRVAIDRPNIEYVVIGVIDHSEEFDRFLQLIAGQRHRAVISATGDPFHDRQLLSRGCQYAREKNDVVLFVRQLAAA